MCVIFIDRDDIKIAPHSDNFISFSVKPLSWQRCILCMVVWEGRKVCSVDWVCVCNREVVCVFHLIKVFNRFKWSTIDASKFFFFTDPIFVKLWPHYSSLYLRNRLWRNYFIVQSFTIMKAMLWTMFYPCSSKLHTKYHALQKAVPVRCRLWCLQAVVWVV